MYIIYFLWKEAFPVFALRNLHLLPFLISSPAEEAGRDQPSVSRHVELCYPAVGIGDKRSALC